MNKIEQANKRKSKKKRNRLLFRSIILVVLFGALVFALVSSLTGDQTTIIAGNEVEDFQLKQYSSEGWEPVTFKEEFAGKGIMLNFWATWCGPCEDEMPYMQTLYPEYKEKGVEIVAVSIDKTEKVINDFIDKYQLTFPILHDKDQEVADLYGIIPLPTSIFINPEGEIVEKVEGPLTLDRLEGYLQQIQPD